VNSWAIAQSLAILTLANTSPLLAKKVFGNRFAAPLDRGMMLIDGKALFGRSKTVRGIVVSILVTAVGAPIFGVAPEVGALMAAAAMSGDLLSSFVKRRLGLPPSSEAVGLDQVPESALPLLAGRHALLLSWTDMLISVALFFVGQILFSRLFHRRSESRSTWRRCWRPAISPARVSRRLASFRLPPPPHRSGR
jgi:CDP-diglyceride synthetase